MTDRYSELRRIAEQHRKFADLALCDAARDDHLKTAAFFDRIADKYQIDYSAITRDICYLS